MTTFVIGLKKKIPFIMAAFDTVEQADAAGAASDAEDYTTCSPAKLGDHFTLTELAHIYNALPGEEKVERFSDKQSAVKRVLQKFDANKDDLAAPKASSKRKAAAEKKPKAKKEKAQGGGRPSSLLRGKIKPLKREGKRWQKDSPRSIAFKMLEDKGTMPVEDFINAMMKEQKLSRPQALGIISKLRAVKMAEVVG